MRISHGRRSETRDDRGRHALARRRRDVPLAAASGPGVRLRGWVDAAASAQMQAAIAERLPEIVPEIVSDQLAGVEGNAI